MATATTIVTTTTAADALTGQKNPDELGRLLDCADEDADQGEGGSLAACS